MLYLSSHRDIVFSMEYWHDLHEMPGLTIVCIWIGRNQPRMLSSARWWWMDAIRHAVEHINGLIG